MEVSARSRIVRAVGVLPVAHGHVDGREPLRRVAVDERRLRAPGMRVGMLEPPARQKLAGGDQRLDDGGVGVALLALRREDRLAPEQGQVGAEGAVLHDVVSHWQAVLLADLVVVVPVAGGGVDETRAGVVRDVVAREHGDVVVPFAVGVLHAAEGVGHDEARASSSAVTSRRRRTRSGFGRRAGRGRRPPRPACRRSGSGRRCAPSIPRGGR
jgi:hypothetical protein